MVFKLFLLISIINFPAFAQWETGASFNYKNEFPEKGFGIFASRNLPVQFASFGVKTRVRFDYFFNQESNQNNFNADLNADLLTSLFYRNFHPYFIMSIGGSHYSVNNFNEYLFILGLGAGIKFPISNWLQPFVEINAAKYFSSFDEQKTGKKISSVQIIGKVGLLLRI